MHSESIDHLVSDMIYYKFISIRTMKPEAYYMQNVHQCGLISIDEFMDLPPCHMTVIHSVKP